MNDETTSTTDMVEIEIDEDVYQQLKALADDADMDMWDFVRERLLVFEIPGATD